MRFLIAIISVFLLFPGLAQAQSYAEMYEQISTINRVQPLQNPGYKRTYEILNRKVHDRKSRVVGEVRDVLVSQYGPVDSLTIDLDRLRLGEITVNIEETGIDSRRNTYAFVNYDEEGIEDLYPTLLASIQTAAGAGSDVVSLEHLLGATVKSDNGDRIGKVEDVLFNSNGNLVEALYIDFRYKNIRKESIAIPFGAGDYASLSSDRTVVLFADQVKAMSDYLAANK